MSDAVQIEIVHQIPSILAGVAALLAAVMGFINRQGIKDVHRDLNGALNSRVIAANAEGRIQERTEKRKEDEDLKSLG
jgi:hypothetical protein